MIAWFSFLPSLAFPLAPNKATSTHPPKTVTIGGGYDDAKVAQLMSACGVENGNGKGVLWLRAIPPKEKPVLGEEFMRKVAEGVKIALGKLGAEGKLEGGKEGVVWF